MILGSLLEIELSEWEEKLLSVAFLSNLPLISRHFVSAKLESAWIKMQSLPNAWVRELALGVLVAEKDSYAFSH